MKYYLLNAEEKRKRKVAGEAIKKSKEILNKKNVFDVEVLENEEMWAQRVIDESKMKV
jgi:hypothetical protein